MIEIASYTVLEFGKRNRSNKKSYSKLWFLEYGNEKTMVPYWSPTTQLQGTNNMIFNENFHVPIPSYLFIVYSSYYL